MDSKEVNIATFDEGLFPSEVAKANKIKKSMKVSGFETL